MKLALIQEKQNALYLFKEDGMRFEVEDIYKFQKEMQEQNLMMISQAADKGVDLVVTSEAVNFPGQPFKYMESPEKIIENTQEEFKRNCAEAAKLGRMFLAVGMFRVKQDGKLYNSVVIFDRNGEEIFEYDKNFLAGDEKEYLTPGNEFPVWESEFGRIGIGICWDMQFPETARAYAKQQVDLIVCPTWGWESLYGRSRAYENGIYVAAAMAIPAWKPIEGKRIPSEIIGPDGVVLERGNTENAEVIYCEIEDITNCKAYREMRMNDLNLWEKRRQYEI